MELSSTLILKPYVLIKIILSQSTVTWTQTNRFIMIDILFMALYFKIFLFRSRITFVFEIAIGSLFCKNTALKDSLLLPKYKIRMN